jgi:hypothetical protein
MGFNTVATWMQGTLQANTRGWIDDVGKGGHSDGGSIQLVLSLSLSSTCAGSLLDPGDVVWRRGRGARFL